MAREALPMPRLYKVAEGLFFGRVYWVMGDMPSTARQRNEVKSPPCSGWSHAFLIDKGGKLVTLFCPSALEGFQVTRNSSEVQSMGMDQEYVDFKPTGFKPWTQQRQEQLLGIIQRNWEMAGRLSLPSKDFDTAAVVLQMLGGQVPLRIVPEGAEPDKPRGGKEADVLGLLKPVKRDSKRGLVLAFFLPQPRSIREAMAEFGYSRSNVLSHLFILQKEHGIGYSLTGDAATISLPAGCVDPFAGA